MKLNYLPRLTALLLAVMMLGVSFACADSAIDLADLTNYDLVSTNAAAEMIAAGRCDICAKELANLGIVTWPLVSTNCLHTYLSSMTPGEAYDMLYPLYESSDWLYDAYINAHQSHVMDKKDPWAICYEGCAANNGNKVSLPGPNHTQGTCPWWQETEHVPAVPIITTPDVSSFAALKTAVEKGNTNITLTYAAADAVSYTWQTTTDPSAADPVWTDVATGDSYVLTISADALATVYRCVATDASDNVTASSTLYLGGRDFFNWATSTESDGISVATWISTSGATMEYILAAYAGALKGILLTEAIYLATIDDVLTLIELLGLSTLAVGETAADGVTIQLVDARYHIPVATVVDGLIYPLTTN